MRRKLKILLIVFLVCGASVFLFLTPRLSHVDEAWELSMRKGELQEWARRITEFENDMDRLPHSLYEAAWYKNAGPTRLKVMTKNLLVPDMQKMRDPNRFFEEVEYFLSKHKHGWFVVESIPGKRYPYRLTIDEKGNIFELKERNVKKT